ncbi:MAG: alpha/beta hydrolase [Proteobacteria bacterium]|nr:alpha/beta hydrolase [Pseudomonadota bacterium]
MTSSQQDGYAISNADGTPIFFCVSAPKLRSDQGDRLPPQTPVHSSGGSDATSTSTANRSENGSPSLRTVALCDGIGCDGFAWKYLRRDLASSYRIVHWHYRGHGRTPSPRDRERLTIPDLADDLASVLDECRVERAVLIGHSMGVQVSLETYRRHRERVSAMVLMCGSPAHPLKTVHDSDRLEALLPRLRNVVARAPWLFNRLSRAILPTRASYLVATLLEVNAKLLKQSDFMPYLRGISRVDLELFLDMLSAANRHSARDLLPEIDVPVLIVAGSRDGFTPPWLSVEMHRTIPNAELLTVDNGTHTTPIERPEQVGQKVMDFLDRRVAD